MLSNKNSRVDPISAPMPPRPAKRSLNISNTQEREFDGLVFEKIGVNTIASKDKPIVIEASNVDSHSVLGEITPSSQIDTVAGSLSYVKNKVQDSVDPLDLAHILSSINIMFLAPILGDFNITSDVPGEAKYGHNGSKTDFSNGGIGVTGNLVIEFATDAKYFYIPRVPVYCDRVAVPIHISTPASDREAKAAFVSYHYALSIPYIQDFNTSQIEFGSNVYPSQLSPSPASNKRVCKITKSNMSVNGTISTAYAENVTVHEKETAPGVATVFPSSPNCLWVSDSPICDTIGVEFSNSRTAIPQIDIYELNGGDEAITSVKIEYQCVPLSVLAMTNQAGSSTEDFSSRVSGSQSIALVPVSVTFVADDIEAEARLYDNTSMLFINKLMSSSASSGSVPVYPDSDGSTNVESPGILLSLDDDLSICSYVYKATRSNAKYGLSLCLRVRVGKDETHVFTPCLVNILGSWNYSLSDILATYVLDVKDYSTSTERIYVLHMANGSNIDMHVKVAFSTLGEMSYAYSLCGRIGNNYMLSVSRVDTQVTAAISEEIKTELPVFTPFNPLITGPEGNEDSHTSISIEKSLNTLPLYSASAICNTYHGDSVSATEDSKKNITVWDGRTFNRFLPYIAFDGHGECKLSHASHSMSPVLFPVIFPLPIFFMASQVNMCIWMVARESSSDYIIGYQSDSAPYSSIYNRHYVARDFTSMPITLNDPTVSHDTVVVWDTNGEDECSYGSYLYALSTALNMQLMLHGIEPSSLFVTGIHMYDRPGTNIVISSLIDPVCITGTLSFSQTPIIGSGGVPSTTDFSSVLNGIDVLSNGLVRCTSNALFNGTKLMLGNGIVYSSSSRYLFLTDKGNRYQLLRNLVVNDIYAMSNVLFVSTDVSTSVYVEYNMAVSLVAEVPGVLAKYPVQAGSETVFCTITSSGVATVYALSGGEVLPIRKQSGVVECASSILPSIGVVVCMLHTTGICKLYVVRNSCISMGLETYDAVGYLRSDINKNYPLGIVSNVVSNAGTVSYPYEGSSQNEAYMIESSNLSFPYIEGERLVLCGIKLLFEPSSVTGDQTEYIKELVVTVNGSPVVTIVEETEAIPETVFMFNSVVVGSAKYRIVATAKLVGVKWLMYSLPVLNRSIGGTQPEGSIVSQLRIYAAYYDTAEYIAATITGIKGDFYDRAESGVTSPSGTALVRDYINGTGVTVTAPATVSGSGGFVGWFDNHNNKLTVNTSYAFEITGITAIIALYGTTEPAGGYTVHGMDIYIQDTEPTTQDDYVWIDTNGIDLITQ